MILFDAALYGMSGRFHIEIRKGLIRALHTNRKTAETSADKVRIELNGALVLPGFINSHDHLDFNNYPATAHEIYPGYRQWAYDIQKKDRDIFNRVQKIPLKLRTAWGQYKNLLNGFTTVVNHGVKLKTQDGITDVYQQALSLHSVAFENDWPEKIRKAAQKSKTVVIHMGEGITPEYHREVDELVDALPPGLKIVAVHGVAMDQQQAASFAGLIWCPASNFFLLGKTADIILLKKQTSLAFGTDSTLSSGWNAWDHFRQALSESPVTETELIQMLTESPAAIWGMRDRGQIAAGMRADLLVLPPGVQFASMNPEDIQMVIRSGELRLIHENLQPQWPASALHLFTRIWYGKQSQWVFGDLQKLCLNIRKAFPDYPFPFSF